MSASIKAISYYLPPDNCITNEDLVAQFPHLTDKDIFRSTGIRKRYSVKSENPFKSPKGSDLGILGAFTLIEEHHIDKNTVDFLLFCTEGLDYKAPVTACIIHEKLGLKNECGSVDIPNGCTGFIYGLSMAKGLIESGQAENIILITADVPNYTIHKDDYELKMLFSDAAAATFISVDQSNNSRIGNFVFGTDGTGAKHLIVRGSGVQEPVSKEWLERFEDDFGMPYGKLEMNGTEIFLFAMRTVPKLVDDILMKNNMTMNDIDLVIFHQANGFLLKVLQRKLKIPADKFYVYIENVGNTVSATIPIALSEAIKEGKAKKGNKILLAAFGVGLSWAGTVITL